MRKFSVSIVFLIFINLMCSAQLVRNSNNPIKGIIHLKVEKLLEIVPDNYDDVVIRSTLLFSKSKSGDIILCDPNYSRAYLFDSKGLLKKSLIVIGQGPGEFPKMQGLKVFFKANEIWATTRQKLARFDQTGAFLGEKRLLDYPNIVTSLYIYLLTPMTENIRCITTIVSRQLQKLIQ